MNDILINDSEKGEDKKIKLKEILKQILGKDVDISNLEVQDDMGPA